MRTIEKELYTYKELSDDAKEKALTQFRNDFDFGIYAEMIMEDFKEQMSLIGLDIEDICYSGFWSQGDGASFTGRYSYKKGWKKLLKEFSPNDQEVFEIGEKLQKEQSKYFYSLRCHLERRRYQYSHENTVITTYEQYYINEVEYDYQGGDYIQDLMRDLMRLLYKRLETEYEYQTSDEVLIEFIEDNEYEFYEDGQLF